MPHVERGLEDQPLINFLWWFSNSGCLLAKFSLKSSSFSKSSATSLVTCVQYFSFDTLTRVQMALSSSVFGKIVDFTRTVELKSFQAGVDWFHLYFKS